MVFQNWLPVGLVRGVVQVVEHDVSQVPHFDHFVDERGSCCREGLIGMKVRGGIRRCENLVPKGSRSP